MALYVVTGGAGFIGSHLARALLDRGDRVRVVDDLSTGRRTNLDPRFGSPGRGLPGEFLRGDVGDGPFLRSALQGATGVFHEAAQVSVPASVSNPVASYQVNVMGTLSVLEAARFAGVGKVVFAASSAAYGDDPTLPKLESMAPRPMSPYASGKLAGEALLAVWGQTYGLQTVSLRYFNVYGPGQADDSPYSGVIALFARAVLARTAPVIFGDGCQSRDFVFVEDVVDANLRAMDRSLEPGCILNVGTGRRVTIKELYSRLAQLAGFRDPPRHEAARAGDVPHSLASIERAREKLGFEPRVTLEVGLERTLAWYKARE